jgi:hypothetical protein
MKVNECLNIHKLWWELNQWQEFFPERDTDARMNAITLLVGEIKSENVQKVGEDHFKHCI